MVVGQHVHGCDAQGDVPRHSGDGRENDLGCRDDGLSVREMLLAYLPEKHRHAAEGEGEEAEAVAA